MRHALVGLALLATAATPAVAQDSQFGINSPGTPGRWESVRARTTGGAFAAFDPTSPLMEAQLAGLRAVVVSGEQSMSVRREEVGGTSATLRTVRYPLATLSGPIGTRFALGGGYSTYLDRSFDVVIQDTITLRGAAQPVTDHLSSDGGVSDLRLAGAAQLGRHISIGAAYHLLTGSAKVSATRTFSDTLYRNASETNEVGYDGAGVSGSALLRFGTKLGIAAYARSDTRLRTRIGGLALAQDDLPSMVGGAIGWQPDSSLSMAASVTYRTWGNSIPTAHNTLNWSAGLELGTHRPLRLGVRGGQMPFVPNGPAPRETGLSVGSGLVLAQGHGIIDYGVEYLQRKGGGLTEHVWTILLGFTVRP